MNELGNIALSIGIALSLFAVLSAVLGVVWRYYPLIESSKRALYMSFVASFTAGLTLIYSFVINDFSIKYVYEHSNLALDKSLTWVAFYAGNEGSLLYILIVLCLMSILALRYAPKAMNNSLPYTTAILAGVQAFFFVTISFLANPFELLGRSVSDGLGLNPLLEHPGMFSHPPMLMAGLIGITIPFALVSGTVLARSKGDAWVDYVRVWGILVWGILGVGLLIGAWWAYTILGWGGYWSWDPIENVALMPWLVMTAFIHSIMVQKRRGMFRMWNVVLLNVSWGLSLLGMFINRGGTVVSVHSFGQSQIGFVFLGFLAVGVILSFALFIWRYTDLSSQRVMESFLSREASFLLNNFLLLAVTASVLWGVIFPVFSDLSRDVDVTVSAPYFNRTAGPILLAVVLVMGVGPLLSWRRTTGRSLKSRLILPISVAMLVGIVLLSIGIVKPLAVIAFVVVAFVFGSIMGEWWRGTNARIKAGYNPILAWFKMVNSNRPRHGGYIVHLAMLSLAIGVIGTQFFDQRTDAAINIGQSVVLDDYRIEYINLHSQNRSDRTAQWATMHVFKIDKQEYQILAEQATAKGQNGFVLEGNKTGDRFIGTISPWHGFYPSFNQISVRSGIRSSIVEDLYVIPRDFLQDGRVSLAVSINPLAMWLWIAGPIFLVGTIVALLPNPSTERKRLPSTQIKAV